MTPTAGPAARASIGRPYGFGCAVNEAMIAGKHLDAALIRAVGD
jgi:hypothetical protein